MVKDWLLYKILGSLKTAFKELLLWGTRSVQKIGIIIDDHYLEKKLGVKTCGLIKVSNDISSCHDMNPYGTLPYRIIQNIIKSLQLTTEDIFVDLGCGKGRVVFLAALESPKKSIGVELDSNLVRDAKNNLKLFKFKNNASIEIVHADAARFDVSEGTVFYLFNSFGQKTLVKIIDNIKESLLVNPRYFRIVYLNPAHRDALNQQNWLVTEGVPTNAPYPYQIWHNI